MKSPFSANKNLLNENINLTFENISKPQLLFSENKYQYSMKNGEQSLTQIELEQQIKQAQNSMVIYNQTNFYENLKNIQSNFTFDFQKDQCKSVYIKTLLEFNRMLELLRESDVICWDVHYNTYRSFHGFVCFLEISTQDQDYIIDCLSLRNEIYRLKEIFLNPKILKITLDIQEKMNWLYRDFGILNIVNSIDLSKYLKELNLTSIISYLSSTLLNYPFERVLQIFDFRKRPLTLNEINFLRAFSYFPLRFISTLTENILQLENHKLEELFKQCQIQSCLNLKQLENLLQDNLVDKHFEMLCFDQQYDNKQKYYLKKIVKWRLNRAKLEDESVEYIFPACVIQKFISCFPQSPEQVLYELKRHQQEISLDHYSSFFSFFDERSYSNHLEKQQQLQLQNQNNNNNVQSSQHSLSMQSPQKFIQSSCPSSVQNQIQQQQQSNMNNQNEYYQNNNNNQLQFSPPMSPTSLLKNIGWIASNPNEEGTPEKNYKDLISRQNLSPSILKYSPQNGVDSPLHDNVMKDLLSVINERNSKNSQAKFQESIRREIEKINNMGDQNDEEEEQLQEDIFQMNLLNKLHSKQYYIKNTKENLPNNIADIFELANRKRKINKDKKRKRDDKSPSSNIQQKETKEKEKLNIDKLLSEIKWI